MSHSEQQKPTQTLWSTDDENFIHDSFLDAVADVVRLCGESKALTRSVYRAEFTPYDPARALRAIDVIESANERAADELGGDDLEHVFDDRGAAVDELDAFLADWARRNGIGSFLICEGKSTVVPITEQDISAAIGVANG